MNKNTGKQAATALKQFEIENNIKTVDPDAIYQYDEKKQQAILAAKPWREDINYFKKVKISALALLKMVMHARSGGKLEVMGLMQGKVDGETFVILDSFALPILGTETRVDVGSSPEAVEYMSSYIHLIAQVGRSEVVVGWYHSHPGYGCWLSGTDCTTQMSSQKYQDPFLAIVVDPVKTIGAGKVAIGAFRTYPEGYKAEDSSASVYQTVPIEKIEDFGVHANQYYELGIEIFKSSTDEALLQLLWNKYWINTLSSSPLYANREYSKKQITDIASKIEKRDADSHGSKGFASSSDKGSAKKEESALSKISKDSTKLAVEVLNGLLSNVVKNQIFNVSK